MSILILFIPIPLQPPATVADCVLKELGHTARVFLDVIVQIIDNTGVNLIDAADCDALGPDPACTSNAVSVVFDILRHVHVEDYRHTRDV